MSAGLDEDVPLQARIARLEHQLAKAHQQLQEANPPRVLNSLGVEQLRAIFENFSGGMAFSRNGIIVDCNPGLAQLLETNVDEIVGHPIIKWVVPEDRELVQSHVIRGDVTPYEHRLQRSDGRILPVEATASIVPAADAPLRFAVIRDISDRRQAEENLEIQRRLLQAVLDHMPASIFVAAAPSGRPVLVNQYARELLQMDEIPDIPKEEFAARYRAYVAGTDEPYPMERMPIIRAMSGEESTVDDVEIRLADGSSRLIEVIGAPIYDSDGRITMTVALSQDITARKRTEETLQAEQDFLRSLIKAHERDRQLMAYEVHDGLVQYITAAVWHLDSVCDNAVLDPTTRSTLTKCQSLVRQAIADARRVLSGLRPPVLDEQGIVTAIEYLVLENTSPDGPQVSFRHDVHFSRLESLLEGTIFRVVQETLNNVRKHSAARQAEVSLTEVSGTIQLTICDDGVGFLPERVPADRFGIRGILKRAELVGGKARIESTPGKGTCVRVDFPVAARASQLAD